MADLTTLDRVKRYLFGNEIVSDADEVLSDLITSSSAWVERQIGRTFETRTVTETRNGDGTGRMLLDEGPAVSVTSVTVDGETVPERAAVDGEGWVYSDGGVTLVGYEFTRGVQNVVIVYEAGATVPADLEQAVIEHVALRYRDRGREGLGSASMGGEAATYSSAGALAYIMSVLDAHRDLVVT